MRSALRSSGRAASLDSNIFSIDAMESRIFAARSNSSRAEASSISDFSIGRMSPLLAPMKSISLFAMSRCSSNETLPTHGAAHFPISPSRHCLFVRFALSKLPALQDRIGNTFKITSKVLRRAHVWVNGPKYVKPGRFSFRVIKIRGTSSAMLNARYG